MYYPLSNKEVYALAKGRARVLSHEELRKYPNIDAAIGESDSCIIMYVTDFDGKSASGHWCYIQKKGGIYYYFDPYGFPPDNPLKQMTPRAIAKFGGGTPLTDLLVKSGAPYSYNTWELQNRRGDSKVCGRLVGLRAIYRNMLDDEFKQMLGDDPERASIVMTDKYL